MAASLTALTASVSLPAGIGMKVRSFTVDENFREQDDEGFSDNGYGSGQLTGQRLSGTITGFVNVGSVGLGTKFSNVAMSLTSDTGRAISGTFNFTRFQLGVATGEIQKFSCNYASVGQYSNSGI